MNNVEALTLKTLTQFRNETINIQNPGLIPYQETEQPRVVLCSIKGAREPSRYAFLLQLDSNTEASQIKSLKIAVLCLNYHILFSDDL